MLPFFSKWRGHEERAGHGKHGGDRGCPNRIIDDAVEQNDADNERSGFRHSHSSQIGVPGIERPPDPPQNEQTHHQNSRRSEFEYDLEIVVMRMIGELA